MIRIVFLSCQIYDILMLHVGGQRDEFDIRYFALKLSKYVRQFIVVLLQT